MTESKKTEVNLEVCSGFFRIPTNDIIYNITIIDSHETSTTRVVEKIVSAEKVQDEPAPSPPQPAEASAATPPQPLADSYYQQAAIRFTEDFSQLAAAADPASDDGRNAESGLADLAEMAGDLKRVLLTMKETVAESPAAEQGKTSSNDLAAGLESLAQKIAQAIATQDSAAQEAGKAPEEAPEPAPPAPQTLTRYLFNMDALFQTMYELCTNETVKTHIQGARQKAGEIFKSEAFYDAISPKVSGYSEDDGFLNVPMSDVYQCLAKACSDKTIINLLKKMDKQQGEIFLDQFLPLEIPPTEEVQIPGKADAAAKPAKEPAAIAQDTTGLTDLLLECKTQADQLASLAKTENSSTTGGGLTDPINDAINIVSSIVYDARRMAEGSSLDGQRSQAEIFWQKIKETSLFVHAVVAAKENDPSLSFDAGITAGQQAIEAFQQKLADQKKAAEDAAKEAQAEAASADGDNGDSGEASQDDIDRLLAEMADE